MAKYKRVIIKVSGEALAGDGKMGFDWDTVNEVVDQIVTALTITRVAEPYILRKALDHLDKGRVVIFACGTGNPFFSTDTAVALRAAEINAEVILLAKNVDGIYDSDPKTNPSAKKYDEIKYIDFISQELKAMDTAAVAICMENKTPILCFGLNEPNSIVRVVEGEELGTWIR